jgi:hypothetical protein
MWLHLQRPLERLALDPRIEIQDKKVYGASHDNERYPSSDEDPKVWRDLELLGDRIEQK